jgi:chaperone BCS1
VARKSSEEKTSRITFSGLLNAIDGVAAGEGRLLFATTNHPERLDPALIRPGRIDRRVEIGHADREQLARIFRRFFPEAEPALAEQFANALPERQLAMSAVQAYLIQHAESAEEAHSHATSLSTASGGHLGCALRAAAEANGGVLRLRELEAFSSG